MNRIYLQEKDILSSRSVGEKLRSSTLFLMNNIRLCVCAGGGGLFSSFVFAGGLMSSYCRQRYVNRCTGICQAPLICIEVMRNEL